MKNYQYGHGDQDCLHEGLGLLDVVGGGVGGSIVRIGLATPQDQNLDHHYHELKGLQDLVDFDNFIERLAREPSYFTPEYPKRK